MKRTLFFFVLLSMLCLMLAFSVSAKDAYLEEIPQEWLKRQVNVGFSGGEKKRLSMLEMLFLNPKIALLDEPDSGVDTDAVAILARAIDYQKAKGTSFVIVSHYPKLISLAKPNFVHVMESGKIVKTGDITLAEEIENQGFGDGK